MSLKCRKLPLGSEFQPSSLPHSFMLKLVLKTHREVNRFDSAANSATAGIHLIWNRILCIECFVRCREKCTGTYQMHLWKVHVKGPIHSKLNCAVQLCKKTARETELNVLWHSTGFPSGLSVFFCQFCVSSCACEYGA
jgi:hypothetical protein